MHHMVKFLAIPILLSTTFFMHGCEQKNTAQQSNTEVTPDDRIMKELASEPVKSFAKTAQDPDDIRALRDYDQRFTAVSDDMEDELMQMKESGSLTPEFAAERKRDNIQSALSMLKELDLKTEQGRYIQGLMYQYWDQQQQLQLAEAQAPSQGENVVSSSHVKGLGQFIHAQEQLDHWQAQYPELAQLNTQATSDVVTSAH